MLIGLYLRSLGETIQSSVQKACFTTFFLFHFLLFLLFLWHHGVMLSTVDFESLYSSSNLVGDVP